MAELNAELESLLGKGTDADPARVLDALRGQPGEAPEMVAPFERTAPIDGDMAPPGPSAIPGLGLEASDRAVPPASSPDRPAVSSSFSAPSSFSPTPPSAPSSFSPISPSAPSFAPSAPPQLTHADAEGRASMVDVGAKPWTRREATATCSVWLGPTAFGLVQANALKKGDALAVARIAGIQGAKLASTLIPLCHPVALSTVGVDLELHEPSHSLLVRVTAVCVGPTGVEMEAMAGASAAALAAYDMVKGVERGVRIDGLRLLRKVGGKSGEWIGS